MYRMIGNRVYKVEQSKSSGCSGCAMELESGNVKCILKKLNIPQMCVDEEGIPYIYKEYERDE